MGFHGDGLENIRVGEARIQRGPKM